MEKCYFLGDNGFQNLQEAVEYFIDHYDYESGEDNEITVYKKQDFTHNSFLRVDSMLADMSSLAYDETEYAEDYLSDIIYNKEKVKQLEKLILNFLEENASSPSFWQGVGEPLEVIKVNNQYLIDNKYL